MKAQAFDYSLDTLKQPPCSIPAEQSVLGGLMLDNSAWGLVSEKLKAGDFYKRQHQVIFSAIERLAENKTPFDIVTLSDSLKEIGELENVGGLSYLIVLAKDTPSAANIEAYASIVKKYSLERDMIANGEIVEAQEWKADLSGDIDFMIPENFGVAAEVQRWILRTSIKVQPALAFAATLAIMGAIVGRYLSCDGTKGNYMSICIAESTEGKDHPLKCVKSVLDAVGLSDAYKGSVNSGAALMDILDSHPSTVLLLDEMGHFLANVKAPGASQYTREVMPMLTELYTCASTSYKEKAKKQDHGRVIIEPNLSVFGVTTERQIMDGFRTSELADGSLGRFGVFFGKKNVRINESALDMPDRSCPESTIKKLKKLKMAVGNNALPFLESEKLKLSPEYIALKNKIIVQMNDKGIDLAENGGNKAVFKPFYGRLAVQAVQVSLLIDQCGNPDVLAWAAALLEANTEIFIKKFLHGASDNENERQVKLVERAIKEGGKKGITAKDLSNATRQVVTHQKKAIIAELLEVGKVFTKDEYRNGSRKPTTVYFWRK